MRANRPQSGPNQTNQDFQLTCVPRQGKKGLRNLLPIKFCLSHSDSRHAASQTCHLISVFRKTTGIQNDVTGRHFLNVCLSLFPAKAPCPSGAFSEGDPRSISRYLACAHEYLRPAYQREADLLVAVGITWFPFLPLAQYVLLEVPNVIRT